MSTEVGRSATLPPNLKFYSAPCPLEGIVPRNSFSASVTPPPNLKICSVPCPPRRAVPPRFRQASAIFDISFRSVSTGGYCSAKLIFRFRHASAEPQILFRSATPHFFDSVLCPEKITVYRIRRTTSSVLGILVLTILLFLFRMLSGITTDITYKKHRRVVGPRGTRETKLTRNARAHLNICLLYTSPSPRDGATSRMPSSA